MSHRILRLLIAGCLLFTTNAFAALPEVSLAAPVPGESLPVYPHAALRNESDTDALRLKSVFVGGPLHGSLTAATYVSKDSAEKILGFYRSALKTYGEVVECADGTNPDVNVRIDTRNLDDRSCHPEDFGSGATELRVGNGRDQQIVTVRPTSGGSEFTLVSIVRRSSRPRFF